MKRIIATAFVAVLSMSLGLAQPAAAGCEEGQVARVTVESEAAGEVDPFTGGATTVVVEAWASEDDEQPVTVSAFMDGSGLVCSDLLIEEIVGLISP